jgi:hypothetical protein
MCVFWTRNIFKHNKKIIIEQTLWRTYILYLSSLHLIELREEEEKKAEAKITRERKWSFFFYIFFLNDTSRCFFPLFLSLPPPLCAITWVVCFLILCNHPSIYISICRQNREKKKHKRTKTLLFILLVLIHRVVINNYIYLSRAFVKKIYPLF